MSPSAAVAGRRLLVWMIAVSAMVEPLLQSILAAIRGAYFEFLVWIVGVVAVLLLAISIETVKSFLDG